MAEEDQKRKIEMRKKYFLIKHTYENITLSKLKEYEIEEKYGVIKVQIKVTGRSLGLFKPNNPIRKLCHKIVANKHYNNIVLGLIAISTIVLAIDNPLYDKKS